ncbi:rCG61948 [Rattus norvegicus]|uniref:RCG61948 n=1 Tax=Rattus norvegicus TaxID=10116 RepID=A6HBS2_RAT|nr:rCG61948 [Rattus norvegicus]
MSTSKYFRTWGLLLLPSGLSHLRSCLAESTKSLRNKYLLFTKVNEVYIQILNQNPKDLCLSGCNNFFSSFVYILYPG